MNFKTLLASLSFLGVTQGAVAQSSEPKTEDKKTDTIEATVMGGGTINVTPVQSSPKSDVEVTVKDGVPTAGMKVKLQKTHKTPQAENMTDEKLNTLRERISIESIPTSETIIRMRPDGYLGVEPGASANLRMVKKQTTVGKKMQELQTPNY